MLDLNFSYILTMLYLQGQCKGAYFPDDTVPVTCDAFIKVPLPLEVLGFFYIKESLQNL